MRLQLSQVTTSSPRRTWAIACGRSAMKQAMQAPLRASATATPSRMRALMRRKARPLVSAKRNQPFAFGATGRQLVCLLASLFVKRFRLASRSEFREAISSARSLSELQPFRALPSVQESEFPEWKSVCGRRRLRGWRRCTRPVSSTTSNCVRRVRLVCVCSPTSVSSRVRACLASSRRFSRARISKAR